MSVAGQTDRLSISRPGGDKRKEKDEEAEIENHYVRGDGRGFCWRMHIDSVRL